MTVHDVSYNRQRPEEWDSVVSDVARWAPETYNESTSVSHRRMVKTLKSLDDLGGEELESTAYYGLGLGMRHLLPELLDPEVNLEAVTKVSEEFGTHSWGPAELFYSPTSYEKTYLARSAGTAALLPPAMRAFNALPPAEHFAVDSLVTAAHIARRKTKLSRFSSSYLWDDLRDGTTAARWVALNSLTGALDIISIAARKRDKSLPPLSIVDFRSGPFLRAAAWMSKLHNEEFSDSELVWRLFSTDEAGNLVFNRHMLPQYPHLPDHDDRPTKAIHNKRLECPAFNVGGLRLLSCAVGIVWDAAHTRGPS